MALVDVFTPEGMCELLLLHGPDNLAQRLCGLRLEEDIGVRLDIIALSIGVGILWYMVPPPCVVEIEWRHAEGGRGA